MPKIITLWTSTTPLFTNTSILKKRIVSNGSILVSYDEQILLRDDKRYQIILSGVVA
jgi:hypothetical protein